MRSHTKENRMSERSGSSFDLFISMVVLRFVPKKHIKKKERKKEGKPYIYICDPYILIRVKEI
jgi:hypothetical protein